MKRVFLKITKSSIINFGKLTILVIHIGEVMNACHLIPLSADVNDLKSLNLRHLLVGGPLLNVLENNAILDYFHLSSKWTLVQRFKKSVLELLEPI